MSSTLPVSLQLSEFEQIQKQNYQFAPIWCEIKSDLFTPVIAYQTFRHFCPYSFILESVNQNEKQGRFSIIGFDPIYRFEVKQGVYRIFHKNKEVLAEKSVKPLKKIANFMQENRPYPDPNIRGFDGILIGYLGYSTIQDYEKVPSDNPDDLDIADIQLMIPSCVLVFDHLYQTLKLICLAETSSTENYHKALDSIHWMTKLLQDKTYNIPILPSIQVDEKEIEFESNMKQEEFMEIVNKAKQYILNGDIFQVVLSQRFQMNFEKDAFQIYRSLRANNPSPYHYHLQFEDYSLSGSSPEVLVKKEEQKLTLRPIAGTRKRGKTLQEDEALENEMLQDPKEVAEHMMLVDLGRNDLGRICEFHSVKVDEILIVEKYSHVMHLVSNVSGNSVENLDIHDLMRAVFPAGTLSGAPKIRAMEIIDELETIRRNTYAGTVLKMDFHGNIDACITIRSVLVKNNKAYIQAGAGIVADSVPEAEYLESFNKAKAVMRAIQACIKEDL